MIALFGAGDIDRDCLGVESAVPVGDLRRKNVLDRYPRRQGLDVGLAIGELVGPSAGLRDVQLAIGALKHGIALRRRLGEQLCPGPVLAVEDQRSGSVEGPQRRFIQRAVLLQLERSLDNVKMSGVVRQRQLNMIV